MLFVHSGDVAWNHIPTVSTRGSWAHSGHPSTTISPSVPHRNTSEDQLSSCLPHEGPCLMDPGEDPWQLFSSSGMRWLLLLGRCCCSGEAPPSRTPSAAGPAQDSSAFFLVVGFFGCLYWTMALLGHLTGWFGMSFGAS